METVLEQKRLSMPRKRIGIISIPVTGFTSPRCTGGQGDPEQAEGRKCADLKRNRSAHFSDEGRIRQGERDAGNPAKFPRCDGMSLSAVLVTAPWEQQPLPGISLATA